MARARPLIEEAEGKDQDQRSMLIAAFSAVLNSQHRRHLTDLHVRELLTYVLVSDRDGRGVQMSYYDVARVICCEYSTARAVVKRALEVFGLLDVIEDRYTRGGQAPNRYSIDWAGVRRALRPEAYYGLDEPTDSDGSSAHDDASGSHWCELDDSDDIYGPDDRTESAYAPAAPFAEPAPAGGRPAVVPQQPPVVPQQAPAVRQQGPAVPRQGPVVAQQPSKEITLYYSLSSPSLSKSAAAAKAAEAADGWKDLDWEEARRRANQLLLAAPQLDRMFVWQVTVVIEHLLPGKVAEWISKLRRRDDEKVKDPYVWLNIVAGRECERYGCDWYEIRRLVPDPGPPPEDVQS